MNTNFRGPFQFHRMHVKPSSFKLITAAIAFACGYVQWDQAAPVHDVIIEIASASAFRWHSPNTLDKDYTMIDCKLVIINTLPNNLRVRSGYESPFHGIAVTVEDSNGRVLGDGYSISHNAPYYDYPGKAFYIPPGRTTNELKFTIDNTFPNSNVIKIYAHGILVEALSKSKFSYSVTSNVVVVNLK